MSVVKLQAFGIRAPAYTVLLTKGEWEEGFYGSSVQATPVVQMRALDAHLHQGANKIIN